MKQNSKRKILFGLMGITMWRPFGLLPWSISSKLWHYQEKVFKISKHYSIIHLSSFEIHASWWSHLVHGQNLADEEKFWQHFASYPTLKLFLVYTRFTIKPCFTSAGFCWVLQHTSDFLLTLLQYGNAEVQIHILKAALLDRPLIFSCFSHTFEL